MEHKDTGDMPGMMTADEMTALEKASDGEFQDMWLEMMIKHHEGAVEMSETEHADGQYKPAINLAEHIESSQSKEIATMKRLMSQS